MSEDKTVQRPYLLAVILLTGLGFSAFWRAPDHAPRDVAPTGAAARFAALLPLGRERFAAPLPTAPDSAIPENAWLAINERGLDIIRRSEGLRLRSYFLAGQWLIGYGHAATAREGMAITAADADLLLLQDVRVAEEAVRRIVRTPLNENEFSALACLAYNLGSGAFARTRVVERLNSGDRAGASAAFRHLVTAEIGGVRVELASLKRRRELERALFLTRPVRA